MVVDPKEPRAAYISLWSLLRGHLSAHWTLGELGGGWVELMQITKEL
jgi:hypothetical protein